MTTKLMSRSLKHAYCTSRRCRACRSPAIHEAAEVLEVVNPQLLQEDTIAKTQSREVRPAQRRLSTRLGGTAQEDSIQRRRRLASVNGLDAMCKCSWKTVLYGGVWKLNRGA
mmetsp:Transcript_65175/g.130999  ORF Transcript_65175/g.130999 Transcript_65175/m.130999 type:complete len:112 (+) Transcript_65175:105-440(+)